MRRCRVSGSFSVYAATASAAAAVAMATRSCPLYTVHAVSHRDELLLAHGLRSMAGIPREQFPRSVLVAVDVTSAPTRPTRAR